MSEIYFAQPTNGGPIRVGTTMYSTKRIVSISSWHPNGVEIVATVPGSICREAAIHFLLRPFGLGRDWFRSCPEVWEFLLDARSGALAWLPSEIDRTNPASLKSTLRERVHTAFGSDRALMAACGFKTVERLDDFYDGHGAPSCKLFGGLTVRELAIAGFLPSYTRAWPADPLRTLPPGAQSEAA